LDSKYNQAFDTNKYDELYAVGWPSSASDYFLDPIKDQKQFESRRESYSL
jgi:putative lipoprotein